MGCQTLSYETPDIISQLVCVVSFCMQKNTTESILDRLDIDAIFYTRQMRFHNLKLRAWLRLYSGSKHFHHKRLEMTAGTENNELSTWKITLEKGYHGKR